MASDSGFESMEKKALDRSESIESLDSCDLSKEEDEDEGSISDQSDWTTTSGPAKVHCLEIPTPPQKIRFPLAPSNNLKRFPEPRDAFRINIFDSHCHLDRIFSVIFDIRPETFYTRGPRMQSKLDYYGANSPLGLLRAKYCAAFGTHFEGCIHVNCNPLYFDSKYWQWIVDNGKSPTQHQEIWLALGCHPKKARDYQDYSDFYLEKALQHPKVVAVGEFGLDDPGAENDDGLFFQQQGIFRRHLELAVKFNKPMVLHIRGPNSTLVAKEIMREMEVPKDWPIHMHCFTDPWEDCRAWSEEWTNMKFGVTPDAFDGDIAVNLPLSRILLETDAPYFPPKMFSQKRCGVPADIWFVAQQVAYFKKVSVRDVLLANRDNVSELYGIPKWVDPSRYKSLTPIDPKDLDKVDLEENCENEENWIRTCGASIPVTRASFHDK